VTCPQVTQLPTNEVKIQIKFSLTPKLLNYAKLTLNNVDCGDGGGSDGYMQNYFPLWKL
jgi:hypothetical protein